MASAQLLVIGLLLMVIVVAAKKDHTNDEEYLDYKLCVWTIIMLGMFEAAAYSHDFKAFKKRTKRKYDTTSDENIGYDNFKANREYIANYPKNATFKMSLMHPFADIDSDTFNRLYNGHTRPPAHDNSEPIVQQAATSGSTSQKTTGISTQSLSLLTPPVTSKDWRTAGYVSPVPYQGACGSCWAIAALGALESAWYKSKGKKIVASVQNVLDCAGSAYGNSGCAGGAIPYAWNYIVANRAVNSAARYPYEAVQNPVCRFDKTETSMANMLRYYNVAASESSLLAAVTQIGPISVTIDASLQSFQLYSSGIYSDAACKTTNPNHGVLVVGFGVDGGGVPFWLVRNSWGTQWGESGYMRIARNQNNMCGIASYACYPVIR